MVGGTSFHRGILKASRSRNEQKQQQHQEQQQRLSTKYKPKPRDSASLRKPRESQTLYVSLDNAVTVIEGGPLLRRDYNADHSER